IGSGPRDELGHRIARVLQTPGRARDALTRGLFVPSDPEHPLGRLENAFRLCVEADGVARRIRKAVKAGTLPRNRPENLIEPALEAGILTPEEADLMRRAEAAREDAIQVDAFTLEEYLATAAGARKSARQEAALR
ncbi:MAG: acyl-CoA dehydrogenase domain-containing protein, partial [Planctomycetota bacterium]